MTIVAAAITISLDGYITGPNDGPGNGLGDGGERLHYWGSVVHGATRRSRTGRRRAQTRSTSTKRWLALVPSSSDGGCTRPRIMGRSNPLACLSSS